MVTLFVLAGCSSSTPVTGATKGGVEATASIGHGMAGPAQQVYVSKAALDDKPAPWVLTTPKAAVQSYLDWTSYAYRIAQSEVASPTMGAFEAVRIDSYVQYNLQKSRIIDQTLQSITFVKSSTGATSTTVVTKEKWTYSYVSIDAVAKVLGGPYTATYDVTYTVVKSNGRWVVDSVAAKALGTVK